MPVATEYVNQAKASFDRFADNSAFFDTFYGYLLSSNEEIKARFDHTNFLSQNILSHSL